MKSFVAQRIAAFLPVLLVTACLIVPERDCAKHKTGTFFSYTLLEGDSIVTTFIRNDSLEVEYFQGSTDTSTVRWINDCEYILKNRNPKNRAEEKSIHIKILTTTDSSYTFEFNAVGSAKKLRATAYKKH